MHPIWIPRSTHFRLRSKCCSGVPPGSWAAGVGHPVEPLSDVRRVEARSAQIGGPDSIAQSFQVSAYSGEPLSSKSARNLLAKRDCRLAEADEVPEERPDVPGVRFAFLLPGLAEGLAGAGAGAHGLVIRPSGQSKSQGPSADAAEEMLLGEAGEFMRFDIGDAAFVHFPGRDESFRDEFAQPRGGFGVEFVIVGHAADEVEVARKAPTASRAWTCCWCHSPRGGMS